ncbi:hypothetical protein PMAYCL1PPCAC_25429, partial [Pristionchus mayeri]
SNNSQRVVAFDNDNRITEFRVDGRHNFQVTSDSKYIIFFNIKINNSKIPPIIDLTKFCSTNEKGNVTLVFRDNKLRVSKELLAIHSSIFASMLFGDSVEKDKEDVEIKDVDYEDFIDLLQFIYPCLLDISDRSVLFLLKLAYQFKMESVLNKSEKYLIQSEGIDVVKKLLFADQYELASLKDYCLNIYPRKCLLQKVKSSPEFTSFSAKMVAEIEPVKSSSKPNIDVTKFCSHGMGNIILVFGDNKLLVSKEYLAVHSPVFAAMFYSDFAEKKKEEVEISDVIYEEFLDILQLIYPQSLEIT